MVEYPVAMLDFHKGSVPVKSPVAVGDDISIISAYLVGGDWNHGIV